MTINNIRRNKKGELVLDGYWQDYSNSTTSLTEKEYKEMLAELKEAEMDTAAKQYEEEYDAAMDERKAKRDELEKTFDEQHRRREDYDSTTGQVREDTKAAEARQELLHEYGREEKDLYNPLHEPIEGLNTLNKGGEFPTKDAAAALAQIPGVQTGTVRGHDIAVTYKGRTSTLTGGSGGTGQTDANAVDQIIENIVEQDIKQGHVHEEHRAKRRDAIKNSIYR